MTRLPAPRNVRTNWKTGELNLDECAAEVSRRIAVPERWGRAIECRCWVMARGWRKGMLKRVDVAYEGDACFASVRFSGRFWTLRCGAAAAV